MDKSLSELSLVASELFMISLAFSRITVAFCAMSEVPLAPSAVALVISTIALPIQTLMSSVLRKSSFLYSFSRRSVRYFLFIMPSSFKTSGETSKLKSSFTGEYMI